MKKLSIKQILIYSIPALLLLLLLLVYKYKNNNNAELSDSTKNALLIPDSEEESIFSNKVEAYKNESEENKRNKRIQEVSKVKNSDFFKEVGKLGENSEDSPLPGESVEEYYERAVGQKLKKSTAHGIKQKDQAKFINISLPDEEEDEESEKVQTLYAEMYKKQQAAYKRNPAPSNDGEDYVPTSSNANNARNQKEEVHEDIFNDGKRRRRSTAAENGSSNLIQAAIHGDQTVTSGETVRLRLLENAEINGVTIPKSTIIYGTAKFGNDRMDINITSIKLADNIINVKFDVYDTDAIKGLNLPESVKANLAKKATSNTTDQVQLNSSSAGGGIVGTAISTGINTIKQVVRKDINQVRVSLKSNYNIYLKN